MKTQDKKREDKYTGASALRCAGAALGEKKYWLTLERDITLLEVALVVGRGSYL